MSDSDARDENEIWQRMQDTIDRLDRRFAEEEFWDSLDDLGRDELKLSDLSSAISNTGELPDA